MTRAKTDRRPVVRREHDGSSYGAKKVLCTTPVDASRARITVCPTPGPRFAPAPGHIGEFSRAGIGRYVAPDDEIETEGMGL